MDARIQLLHSRDHRQEKNGNQRQDARVKCMLDGLDRESSFERGIAEKYLKYLPTEKELVNRLAAECSWPFRM